MVSDSTQSCFHFGLDLDSASTPVNGGLDTLCDFGLPQMKNVTNVDETWRYRRSVSASKRRSNITESGSKMAVVTALWPALAWDKIGTVWEIEDDHLTAWLLLRPTSTNQPIGTRHEVTHRYTGTKPKYFCFASLFTTIHSLVYWLASQPMIQ